MIPVQEELTAQVLAAAAEVHDHLGPGLLEHAYRRCLAHELAHRGLAVASEVPLPLAYKGLHVSMSYRLDLLVEQAIVVEVKAVSHLAAIHQAQLHTYLRIAGLHVGLLFNFNTTALPDGTRRVVC